MSESWLEKDYRFAAFVVLLTVTAGCSSGGNSNDSNGIKEKVNAKFETSCRLNSFSWITKQPQEAGVALADKPCLGCTIDSENHFCDESRYKEFVAALADFRSVCKANSGAWMLMEPTMNGLALSEKMCWGCMTEEQNHFCSIDEYTNFEGATGNAT